MKLHSWCLAPAFVAALLWVFVAIGTEVDATSGRAEKVFAHGPQLRLVIALGSCLGLYAVNAWYAVRRVLSREETLPTRIACGLILLLAPLMLILLAGFCIELDAYLDRAPS